MNAIGRAFAKWSPCIYKGAIVCAGCPLSKADPDEGCDMEAGRTRSQEAFEAGWKQSDLAYETTIQQRLHRIVSLERDLERKTARIAELEADRYAGVEKQRCSCWMCANSKHYHSIKGKCSAEETRFLEEMFSRMACAIMDLESMKMRDQSKEVEG